MPGNDNKGSFHGSELWLVFGKCKHYWRKMSEKKLYRAPINENTFYEYSERKRKSGT